MVTETWIVRGEFPISFWENHLISLSLSFLFCKEMTIIFSPYWEAVKIK